MKYFKHDLTTREDDKIFELIEAHGMQGYGVWWVLLEELYKAEDQGFQIEATETWFKRLSKQLNLTDWRSLIRILDTMAEHGLISPQLWAEHVILAPGMVKRADQYVQAKQSATERKRRQRESARAAVSRVTPARQPPRHNTVTTNTDPDPDPETNTDPDPRFASDLDPECEARENSLRSPEPDPNLEPVAHHLSSPVQPASTDEPAQQSGVNVPLPAAPGFDPFARRGMPHVVSIQAQFEGPWGVGYTDELKRFEAWLDTKARGKSNPSAWRAAVVDRIAKGGSRALWDEFKRFEAGDNAPETPPKEYSPFMKKLLGTAS